MVGGNGSVFHGFGGRSRYQRTDLKDWAASRRLASTVDDGTALAGAAR